MNIFYSVTYFDTYFFSQYLQKINQIYANNENRI